MMTEVFNNEVGRTPASPGTGKYRHRAQQQCHDKGRECDQVVAPAAIDEQRKNAAHDAKQHNLLVHAARPHRSNSRTRRLGQAAGLVKRRVAVRSVLGQGIDQLLEVRRQAVIFLLVHNHKERLGIYAYFCSIMDFFMEFHKYSCILLEVQKLYKENTDHQKYPQIFTHLL